MTGHRIIGVDPSLRGTGVAVEGEEPRTVAMEGTGTARLAWAYRWAWDLVRPEPVAPRPTLVLIEGYSFSSRNSRAHALGELGGVLRLAWHHVNAAHEVLVVEVPPAVVKKVATGRGNAPKAEVAAEAIRRLGYAGYDDNGADALWLRVIGEHLLGRDTAPALPQAHLDGLAKLQLPERAEP